MRKINKIHFLFPVLFFPCMVFAQSFNLANSNFEGVINEIRAVIGLLLPILTAIAFIFFFWGVSKFILNADKPEEIKKGRSYMLWGILALFVLISFQSIIWFISSELEIGGNPNPNNVLLPTS